MRQYLLQQKNPGEDLSLEIIEISKPTPKAGEVLVKVEACSMNYRDLLMKQGKSASSAGGGVVPLSDGAGTIELVGEGVSEFSAGDKVAGTFFVEWEDGKFDMRYHKQARGGSCGGMLAEYVVGPASSFVRAPKHLSAAETSTLPCAGVTAWHSLIERGGLHPGQTVLALGTGGVSIFALQIAHASGAEVIITSSSDEKLETARAMGANHTINYREHEDWEKVVYEITQKRGADHVVEVGGPGTLPKSMASVAAGGSIGLIGVLTGFEAPDASLFPLVSKNVDLSGIYVGSRTMFHQLNHFIELHEIHPVIDREFSFDDAPAAYDYLAGGSHLGKVVITL